MKITLTLADKLNFTKFGLKEITLADIILTIKSGDMQLYDKQQGNYTLKEITEFIRRQDDPLVQNELKERFLPVVTFNGIWDGERISKYSNITALDFDNILNEEQQSQTLRVLTSCPFVYAIFRTFKQYRLKALVLHDNLDPLKHKEMYEQLIDLYAAYGIDKKCKDLSRKTFLSWDKDVWVNTQCEPFHFIPTATQSPQVKTQTGFQLSVNRKPGKSKSPASIINILNSSWLKNHPEYWQRGNRANAVFICACQFCEYGVPMEMANDYFCNGGWMSDDFTESEILKHIYGAYTYKNNNYGSKSFI